MYLDYEVYHLIYRWKWMRRVVVLHDSRDTTTLNPSNALECGLHAMRVRDIRSHLMRADPFRSWDFRIGLWEIHLDWA